MRRRPSGYTVDPMEPTRRSFLSAAAAAAPLLVPRGIRGANDRLAYGLIGHGGRGS